MQQFNDRTAVVEAVQWTGVNTDEVAEFVGGAVEEVADRLIVRTEDGAVIAAPGDWIISDAQGELCTRTPDAFTGRYDPTVTGRYDPTVTATTIGRVKVDLDITEALAKIETVRAQLLQPRTVHVVVGGREFAHAVIESGVVQGVMDDLTNTLKYGRR